MANWTAPPTRREVTIILFSVTLFVLAYNIDASLHLLGFDGSTSLLPFGHQRAAPIGPDGRRLEAFRDGLEDEIVGEWDWDEGRIAGVKAAEETRIKDGGKGKSWGTSRPQGDRYVHGEGLTGKNAIWLQGVGQSAYARGDGLGSTTVNDDFVRWGDDIPQTTLVTHVPGASVLRVGSGRALRVTPCPCVACCRLQHIR